ncbi:hypothetical protein HanIR_Chr05g0227021 [Helianthus annuus]|nr:hypothetical protein HanIR_Chr05g0227021 [Helianthus annuus]
MNSQRDLGSHILFLHKKIRLLKSTLILSDLISLQAFTHDSPLAGDISTTFVKLSQNGNISTANQSLIILVLHIKIPNT